MKNFTITAIAVLWLMAAGCVKPANHSDQYYRVAYSDKDYRAVATIRSGDKFVTTEVALNGRKGQMGSAGYEWHGDGHPDMEFTAMLNGLPLKNRVTYADAPVYDIYFPDTFSRAKGAWFVFNQATHKSDENKQFWIDDQTGGAALFYSRNIADDTVWMPIADNDHLRYRDSAVFQFGVFKIIQLQQTDGNGKGYIELSKEYKKWVQLVP